MTTPARPHLALVSVGGTITTVAADNLDLVAYHEGGRQLRAVEVLERFPDLRRVGEIEPVDFRTVSSTALTEDDWIDLASLVQDLSDRVDGVVIMHGTNTLEETAYFLDLCLVVEVPVVVVGAMRPLSAMSSDAGLNLVRATQVASSPRAAGLGVVVTTGDRIYSARGATKASTTSTDAFTDVLGALGLVAPDGEVVVDRVPRLDRHVFGLPDRLPRVDVVVSHVGADGALIDAAVGAGARGIVSAGAGAGRPTPQEEEALRRAVDASVVVCLSSRVGAAWVAPTPGSVESGFVAGRGLVPWKARILLALALTETDDATWVQDRFDRA